MVACIAQPAAADRLATPPAAQPPLHDACCGWHSAACLPYSSAAPSHAAVCSRPPPAQVRRRCTLRPMLARWQPSSCCWQPVPTSTEPTATVPPRSRCLGGTIKAMQRACCCERGRRIRMQTSGPAIAASVCLVRKVTRRRQLRASRRRRRRPQRRRLPAPRLLRQQRQQPSRLATLLRWRCARPRRRPEGRRAKQERRRRTRLAVYLRRRRKRP